MSQAASATDSTEPAGASIHSLADFRAAEQRNWEFVQQNPDKWLGVICWFSIAQESAGRPVQVTRKQLAEWFDQLMLDEQWLPPDPKKVDAFRDASSRIKDEYSITRRRGKEAQRARLECVEIDTTPEFVLRHVMRRVIGETETSVHVATLKFFRGARSAKGKRHASEHYRVTILNDLKEYGLNGRPTGRTETMTNVESNEIKAAIGSFETRYDAAASYLDSDAIRTVIRTHLEGLNAIKVRKSGGVYFIAQSRQSTVDRIGELVRRIGPGCSLHQLPLLDSMDQRVMLTDAFETEVEDEIKRLLRKIAAANEFAGTHDGKLPRKRFTDLYEAYAEVMERATEYTRVLGLRQERSGDVLGDAFEMLSQLRQSVDPTT